MKKICFVICYFGKLPDYYKIWKYSCSYNEDVDFLVFTDNNIKSEYNNVKIVNLTLKELERCFSEKLNLDIRFENKPYKLCDFKPAYGLLFSEYLEEYDFWGHCDIDQVFGKIRKFITDDILENYCKIQKWGHLTLYKNTKAINEMFKNDGAIYSYKTVFSTDENYAFDETTGINKIFEKNNIESYNKIKIADIDRKYSRYKLDGDRNYNNQIFYWENGEIKRAYIDAGEVKVDEFCYLHFQKRNPKILMNVDSKKIESFYITEKGFLNKKIGIPTQEEIKKIEPYISEKFEKKEKNKYILRKIKDFMLCGYGQKKVWIKQKTKGRK